MADSAFIGSPGMPFGEGAADIDVIERSVNGGGVPGVEWAIAGG